MSSDGVHLMYPLTILFVDCCYIMTVQYQTKVLDYPDPGPHLVHFYLFTTVRLVSLL
jgi:hypothetical protein